MHYVEISKDLGLKEETVRGGTREKCLLESRLC